MGPIGLQELLILLFIVVFLFGAKKLPLLSRAIAQSIGEFRKAKREDKGKISVQESPDGEGNSPGHSRDS